MTPILAKLAKIFNDTSVVVLGVNMDNRVMVIHSFKILGGTILNPTKKYTCLMGAGQIALAVIVDERSMLSHINKSTPTYAEIISCHTKAEI